MYSYAQNFEDVMLARLFPGQSEGCYVDVGAAHPVDLSVTKHFYDLGWRGINIEPIPRGFELFQQMRPLDTNVNGAISDTAGRLTFHEVSDNPALSTFDAGRARELAADGHDVRHYDVPVFRLDDILETHLRGRAMDFLKIDVEGAEDAVVGSVDLGRWTPKVLVIEAVTPLDHFPGWEQCNPLDRFNGHVWEPKVLAAGYREAHFDGLNKFYIRPDLFSDLAPRLRTPPGVFDGIVSSFVAVAAVKSFSGSPDQSSKPIEEIAPTLLDLAAVTKAFTSSLAEKEAVIQTQADAIAKLQDGQRWGLAKTPLRLVRRLLQPRLGNLHQHGPVSLRLPVDHHTVPSLTAPPTISIVTPSFNQGHFITATIDSVLDQAYPALEYFVQDGASTDDTVDVLESYGDRITGWDSSRDTGQSNAINTGFSRTSGEIMGWLNSDDILLPGALHHVAQYFTTRPEIDVVYGHRAIIDDQGRMTGRWIMPPHDDKVLSWVDYIPQETMFWRRTIWDRAGGTIDESFRFAMDWDLILRFRKHGAKFARLPRMLGGFRVHAEQKTSAVISEIGHQEMDRLRQRELGHLPGYLEIRKAVLPYITRHVAADLQWRLQRKSAIPSLADKAGTSS